MEAPYFAHPTLLASKAVLSSWSLVVICALNDTSITGIKGSYRTYIYVYQVLYIYDYIGYLEVCRNTGSAVA